MEWNIDYQPGYTTPMDRHYYNKVDQEFQPHYAPIEKPLFPLNRVGVTVPEHDASGRNKNMLQGVQAAARHGTGTVQIVMMTDPDAAIGGRFKAYGKEVREAMREVAEATGVTIQGVELPTSLNNMSGYDARSGSFNDEIVKRNLNEVADAIRFVGDVAKGGGVDIVSFEFERPMWEAGWNKPDPHGKPVFQNTEEKNESVFFVDSDTGKIQSIPKNTKLFLPFKPPKSAAEAKLIQDYLGGTKGTPEEIEKRKKFFEDKIISKDTGLPELHSWEWKDIKGYSKLLNHQDPGKDFININFQGRIKSAEGYAAQNLEFARRAEERLRELRRESPAEKKEKDKHDLELRRTYQEIEHYQQAAVSQMEEAEKLKKLTKDGFVAIDEYAPKRTMENYAKAGLMAMEETRNKGLPTPIHVGPEIGWPTTYGGHPEEFIKVVKGARQEMIRSLTDPKGKYKFSHHDAVHAAETHVQGLLDTQHLGMWLGHFRKDLPWDQRVKEFKGWYLDQIKKIAGANVVGDIQLVDAISGAHAHLPPGEGILPLREAMQILKDKGFKGLIVSEGHEEEKFGEGRIQTSAWKTVGATIGAGYGGLPPLQFTPLKNNYFGRTYSPLFMVGSYVPSNEFKLWSEVPFE